MQPVHTVELIQVPHNWFHVVQAIHDDWSKLRKYPSEQAVQNCLSEQVLQLAIRVEHTVHTFIFWSVVWSNDPVIHCEQTELVHLLQFGMFVESQGLHWINPFTFIKP